MGADFKNMEKLHNFVIELLHGKANASDEGMSTHDWGSGGDLQAAPAANAFGSIWH